MRIPPTVGRVVWFTPSTHDQQLGSFARHAFAQPLAAIVAYVWSDTMVNLMVIDPNGCTHSRTSIPLWQGEGERPAEFFAEWMPYQKGQAAKAEAAAAANNPDACKTPS